MTWAEGIGIVAGVNVALWGAQSGRWTLGTALALGMLTILGVSLTLGWLATVRYRLRHGGTEYHTCPRCGTTIVRSPGRWILDCGQCGWTAGVPVIRWLTQSVPSRQFRRTFLSGDGVVGILMIGVLVSGAAAEVTTTDVRTLAERVEILEDRDPDGDLLSTANEQSPAYPGADPLHKDIYVRVFIGFDVEELPEGWRATVRNAFARMPVQNPDGEKGITVHFVSTSRLITNLDISGGEESIERAMNHVPPPDGQIPCRNLHTIVLTRFMGDDFAGRGSSPGVASVVDTEAGFLQDRNAKITGTIVHELLHNLVGQRLDPEDPLTMSDSHTTRGWLYGGEHTSGRNRYLSIPVRTVLSRSGFAPREYTQLSCGDGSLFGS